MVLSEEAPWMIVVFIRSAVVPRIVHRVRIQIMVPQNMIYSIRQIIKIERPCAGLPILMCVCRIQKHWLDQTAMDPRQGHGRDHFLNF